TSGGGSGNRQGSANIIPAVLAGVLVLAAIFLAVSGQPRAGLFTGIAALVAGLVVFLQRFGGGSAAATQLDARPLGRGPHRSFICPANQQFLDRLSKMVEPVCETATKQRWDIDWDQ